MRCSKLSLLNILHPNGINDQGIVDRYQSWCQYPDITELWQFLVLWRHLVRRSYAMSPVINIKGD
jgi:hypothetical protein